MKLKSLKNNNQGITLIELLVVVVIIGIMATAVVMSIGAVYGRNASKAATKLSHVLDSARTEALNKKDGSVFVRLYLNANGECIAAIVNKDGTNENITREEVLGNKGLTVKIMKRSASNSEAEEEYLTLSSGGTSSYDFYFVKGTGGFKKSVSTDPELAGILFTSSKKAETVIVWETGRSYAIDVK